MGNEMLKVISLGAGVQSSTLFMMSCLGQIEKADCAIFADTQQEPKSVYEYLEWLESQGDKYGIPVYRVTSGDLGKDITDYVAGNRSRVASIPVFVDSESGGITNRNCTLDYKIAPIKRQAREIMKVKGLTSIEMWIGISIDEVQRMKDSRVKYITHRWPLVDLRMDRNDCKKWWTDFGGRIPPRSACVFCPYHSNAEWRRLKAEEPEAFAEAIEFDERIRDYPKMRSKVYLHRSKMPLKDVDFDNTDQHDFGFDHECEGMCGV